MEDGVWECTAEIPSKKLQALEFPHFLKLYGVPYSFHVKFEFFE